MLFSSVAFGFPYLLIDLLVELASAERDSKNKDVSFLFLCVGPKLFAGVPSGDRRNWG